NEVALVLRPGLASADTGVVCYVRTHIDVPATVLTILDVEHQLTVLTHRRYKAVTFLSLRHLSVQVVEHELGNHVVDRVVGGVLNVEPVVDVIVEDTFLTLEYEDTVNFHLVNVVVLEIGRAHV